MTAQGSDVILQRMMALHPKIIDLTLDRMLRLLDALGNPQNNLPPVVHIAGTNGKGSTQAMIRAGLEAAGKRVHAYTSPHLARFHERIRLAGELITEDALSAVLDECYAANNGETITYFEITTVAAILAFARTPADYTVIAPVSIDHQQYLGDTLAQIAGEKAGIIKRGVPCVVGPQEDDALEVIERTAARLGAPLMVYGQHWHIGPDHGRMAFQDDTGLLDLPLPNLIGAHQVQNAGAALMVLRALGLDQAACTAAVTAAQWPARMQRLRTGPLADRAGKAELWLDGGHNPAAGEALAQVLANLPDRPTHLICGMLNTKDIGGYLRPLAAHTVSLTAVSIPGEANTLPAETTAQAATNAGISARTADDVAQALDAILTADPDARVLICGSLYLAGNILRENG